jgi:LacI family transcriptional regulator, repressor for deo operon, udp, cdd, tsx, nupC, and nupG
MSVKMEDVAQLAGVSTATVSRVLNNPELVSADTRERVMDAIDHLGYRVNLAARSLRTNQTRTIAIVIPTISEPIINQVVEAVEDAAINAQYSLLMCSTRGDAAREQAYIRLLTQQTLVDGVLYVSPRAAPEDVRRLLEGDAPVVLCNYRVEGLDVPSVMANHVGSIYQTTHHLLVLGHTRIALLNLSAPHYQPARMRHKGFTQAFTDAGLVPDDALIVELDQPTFVTQDWRDAIHMLLDRDPPPTGIVAFNDQVALEVYAVCRERGLSIPADLSVTGCDDILFAQYVEPALTTVRVPAYKQGQIAMNILLQLLDQPAADVPASTLLDVELVVRESCAAPRA